MQKISIGAVLLVASSWCSSTFAGYVGAVTPQWIFGSDFVAFGTSVQPAGTCDYFNRYFRFDATTPGGKNMLAILMTAKAAGKTIDVWYIESTAPGLNHTNGCNESNMGRASLIGITQ